MEVETSTAALPVAFVEEGAAARWGRRAVSVVGYLLAAVLITAALPVLLAVALVTDVLRRSRWAATRCLAMLEVYLFCETAGIAANTALGLWRIFAALERERELVLHYALQRWWAGTLFAAAQRIFALRLEVEGDKEILDTPLLVFIRHASLADTLLPAHLLARSHGYRLLYVLKRELLWDPCLDLVGNRLPNVFVRRASGDSAREIDAIRRLGIGLKAREGVLIYPEGTRFSPAKRERALARLAEGRNPERLENAAALRHVLPPHLGGTLALLEAAARADVLFVAHTGLESAARLGDVWRGSLIGRTVRVSLRRVPRAAIPSGRAERITWLDGEWGRLDDWIGRMSC